MIDRILDFSESPARLSVRNRLLVVKREGCDEATVPLADIAVVVVSHPQVSYTQAVLSELAQAGGTFVACNRQHLPVGMFVPLVGHHVQTERIAAQAAAALPVRKRLWRQLVRAKILAQAAALEQLQGTDHGLRALAPLVRSGDPANVEARASRRYWPRVFAETNFRRHRENEDQNLLLNYGYGVLRAAVARAVCAAGLHPSIGLHHHNRYDAYCLADDLMEPFRPTVDRTAAEYCACHDALDRLDSAAKQWMAGAILGRFSVNGESRTLFDALARLCASLADVYLRNREELELPEW